ncbi:MAG: hypothetical protein ACE3JP_03085 [Ectobacillus sp.]
MKKTGTALLTLLMLMGCSAENATQEQKNNIASLQAANEKTLSRTFAAGTTTIEVKEGSNVLIRYRFKPVIPASAIQAEQIKVPGLRPFVIYESELQAAMNSNNKKIVLGDGAKDIIAFSGNWESEIISGHPVSLSIDDLNKLGFQKVKGNKTGPFISAVETLVANTGGKSVSVLVPVVNSQHIFTSFARISVYVEAEKRGYGNKTAVGTFEEVVDPKRMLESEAMDIGMFEEKLPPQLEAVQLPEGFTFNKENGGNYIRASLGERRFTRNAAGDYEGTDIDFSFTLKAGASGTYTLGSAQYPAKITNGQLPNATLYFTPLTLTVSPGLKAVSLPAEMKLNIEEGRKAFPIETVPAQVQVLSFQPVMLGNQNVAKIEIIGGDLYVTPLQPGNTTVKVTATDKFQTAVASGETKINVFSTPPILEAPSVTEVEEKASSTLDVAVMPADAALSCESQDRNIAICGDKQPVPGNGKIVYSIPIQGIKAGETVVTLKVKNKFGQEAAKNVKVIVKAAQESTEEETPGLPSDTPIFRW